MNKKIFLKKLSDQTSDKNYPISKSFANAADDFVSHKVHILISGFNGKMGNAIRGLDIKFDNLTFYDIKKVDLESELKFDLIIDFSSSSFTSYLIERALEFELPILIGTTGLDKSQMQSIKMASQKIPVLFEANFSKGIKLLKRTIKDFLTDNHAEVKLIKIYESHHSNKQDIPSGTAFLLKNFICIDTT